MLVCKTKKELGSALSNIKMDAKKIGLVPTMGALHPGHASLVKKALDENDIAIVSIFVNPTQFNNPEDLLKYPKNLEQDLGFLRTISPEILVFAPSVGDMYPEQTQSNSYDFEMLDTVMEGAFRQGHFNGVGTIVERLLLTVRPDRAYFGEKDYQQLQIIRKLVHIKGIPVEIIGCPIVREANGLAMSSRNGRLSKEMFEEASFIYKTLKGAKEKFGTESAKDVTDWVKSRFGAHPKLSLEYFQISEADTLRPLIQKNDLKKYRAFIAVFAEDVRLIDNIALN
ncbi:MAG: pantoate--beta-alanine ligase [Sediminicola sp.]